MSGRREAITVGEPKLGVGVSEAAAGGVVADDLCICIYMYIYICMYMYMYM